MVCRVLKIIEQMMNAMTSCTDYSCLCSFSTVIAFIDNIASGYLIIFEIVLNVSVPASTQSSSKIDS